RARARAGRWAGRAPRSLDDGPRCAAATTRPTHTRKGYGHEDRRSRSPAVRPGHLAGTRLRRAGRRGGRGSAGTGGRGDHRVARVLGTADALSPVSTGISSRRVASWRSWTTVAARPAATVESVAAGAS